MVDSIAQLSSAAGVPIAPTGSGEVGSVPTSPVLGAISLLSVVVIGAFGALASFGSSLYFLGAMIPFIALGVVAWRAGDHNRPGQGSQDER
jgi:hypothetical protein